MLAFAIEYHKRGDMPAAAAIYEEILRGEPRHRHALYNYGCLVLSRGDHSSAATLFRQALLIAPKDPEYHYALGLALMESGNYAEAEASLQRAIRLRSQPAYYNALGRLRNRQGDMINAISAFRRAVNQDGTFAEAHYNLGNCYRTQGNNEKAVQSWKRAVAANPEFLPALVALGETLRAVGLKDEATAYITQALTLRPDDPELHCFLGDLHQDAGRIRDATMAYRAALDKDSRMPRAWYSLGCAQLATKEYVSAIASFEASLRGEPNWLEAEHNLARALFELGRTTEAMTHFRNCAVREDLARSAVARAMIALTIPGAPDESNASILAARRSWADRDLPRNPAPSWPPRIRERPLRVGYISSFFHRPNWMKPVWGLINAHDRTEFEIHIFSDAPAAEVGFGYTPHSRDHFHDISQLANEEVAALIRASAIDILVDLNSYSEMRRLPLFTLRPAPTLVGWFNLYATSGIDCYDYLIGDAQVIPEAEEAYYTERIRRVPGTCLAFQVNYPVPDVTEPPCVSNRRITFGSLASQIKITSEVVAAWSRILLKSHESCLILKNGVLGSAECREFLHKSFEAKGVARNRVQLFGPSAHFEFLQTYSQIDIALDTFPYNGGTTTSEAIWQGVPVVAFWGDRWVSRTSASILRAGGLGEFVQESLDGYISFAVELAKSPETGARLTSLRRDMRTHLAKTPACDTRAFAREMEKIYKQIQAGRMTKDV